MQYNEHGKRHASPVYGVHCMSFSGNCSHVVMISTGLWMPLSYVNPTLLSICSILNCSVYWNKCIPVNLAIVQYTDEFSLFNFEGGPDNCLEC